MDAVIKVEKLRASPTPSHSTLDITNQKDYIAIIISIGGGNATYNKNA